MVTCPRCGWKIRRGSRHCSQCGYPVRWSPSLGLLILFALGAAAAAALLIIMVRS